MSSNTRSASPSYSDFAAYLDDKNDDHLCHIASWMAAAGDLAGAAAVVRDAAVELCRRREGSGALMFTLADVR